MANNIYTLQNQCVNEIENIFIMSIFLFLPTRILVFFFSANVWVTGGSPNKGGGGKIKKVVGCIFGVSNRVVVVLNLTDVFYFAASEELWVTGVRVVAGVGGMRN